MKRERNHRNVFCLLAFALCGLSLPEFSLAEEAPEATETASDSISATMERRERLIQNFDDRITPEWIKAYRKRRDALLAEAGLDLSVAYSSLSLGALGGGDALYAGSGELSITGIWDLGGKKWDLPMDLNFRLRTRHAYGDRAPSALAGDIGALWGVVDGFSDKGFEIPEFYLKQRFLRKDIELRYGQLSVDSQLDEHALRSAKQAFLNRAFSSDPAVAFPRFGAGLTLVWDHKSGFDFTAAATTVQATKAGDQVDFKFGSSDLFEAIQLGYDFAGLHEDPARVQVMAWRSDAIEAESLPEGRGLTLTVEQEFESIRTRGFFRYAWADGEATDLRHLVAAGVGKTMREFDLAGIAIGAGESSTAASQWQAVGEAFYRWQIAPEMHITPGIQVLVGDGFTGGGDVRVIPGIRGQLTF